VEIIEIKQQAIVSSLSEVSFQFTQLRADVIANPKTFVFKFSPDEIPQYLNYLKQIQNTPLGEELELRDDPIWLITLILAAPRYEESMQPFAVGMQTNGRDLFAYFVERENVTGRAGEIQRLINWEAEMHAKMN
jgi:hypothetical protein